MLGLMVNTTEGDGVVIAYRNGEVEVRFCTGECRTYPEALVIVPTRVYVVDEL